MSVFLVVLALAFFVCLVLATTMQPIRSRLSLAELKRRSKKSDAGVLELDRYELYAALTTLLRTIRALLLVMMASILIGAFEGVGVAIALVLAIVHPALARFKGVKKGGATVYKKIEPKLLDFAARHGRVINAFREPSVAVREPLRKVDSREDLSEIIEHSKEVIGVNERKLLVAALSFPDHKVSSVMTPKRAIDFIKKSEFLGPLVLDELHSLGHSRLPVVNGDLDHIVGILHLRDLLSLDVRRSVTAEKAMVEKVLYIHEDDSVEHALAAFIKTRQHLFIVINKKRETVGLVTLDDVMELLVGRKIIDEDDIHEDVHAVAETSNLLK